MSLCLNSIYHIFIEKKNLNVVSRLQIVALLKFQVFGEKPTELASESQCCRERD